MATHLSSPPPAARKNQRQEDYKSLLGIIVSGLDCSAKGAAAKPHPGCDVFLIDLKALWAAQSIPATTAHCLVRHGVTSRALPALSEYMGIGKGELADLVDLDRATAFRKVASDKPLPMHAAESVLRLLELNQLAEDTFESPEDASAWLRRGHPMLGGEPPLEWAKTAYGTERVKEILIAVKYGGAV